MVRTNDGFEIAEVDETTRPGNLWEHNKAVF
jgi:RecG-like helicase